MLKSDKTYFYLILIHLVIGTLIYYVPLMPKIYGYSIIFGGIFYIINSKNANNEVLYATAYMVGSEIVLRMTDGNPVYEFSKFGVMIFIIIGIYFKGSSKYAVPYWIFLLLLIPATIYTTTELNYTISLRKEISFNISGPVCLALCSIYTYNRRVSSEQLSNILLCIGLPIIACLVYLTLYTPNIKEAIIDTNSNGVTSGGFGPNQVSTMLGLGMFIFVSRMVLNSKSKYVFIINLAISIYMTYRGLITFSRGGVITGFVMIASLLVVSFFFISSANRIRMLIMIGFVAMVFTLAWNYSSEQTNGMIDKRYANKDAAGRVKEDKLSGRGELAEDEFEIFKKHPIIGVGVGRSMEHRFERTGEIVVSHSEITRMIAEHGALGILGLMILFLTPLILYLDNKYNVYLLCFLFFWLLTINHAAMRLAAPAFMYSLSLLKVSIKDEA
ncbi:O-antigen ligase family protein [Flavobacterium sp. CYK-55]|uniref:O-antigen ligase family protein n=1 Tax=Flavobacterium sp. CYK-55 TaxID=2835529 RepID=UPI001BCF8556|nr:O-antigen ligase family protein [Flavobacterium sp. CYK-55]MBS7786394.1 O-antigen ligase family protein [Flavobacterium sp. CYK-55]